jgi:hypothetical protein
MGSKEEKDAKKKEDEARKQNIQISLVAPFYRPQDAVSPDFSRYAAPQFAIAADRPDDPSSQKESFTILNGRRPTPVPIFARPLPPPPPPLPPSVFASRTASIRQPVLPTIAPKRSWSDGFVPFRESSVDRDLRAKLDSKAPKRKQMLFWAVLSALFIIVFRLQPIKTGPYAASIYFAIYSLALFFFALAVVGFLAGRQREARGPAATGARGIGEWISQWLRGFVSVDGPGSFIHWLIPLAGFFLVLLVLQIWPVFSVYSAILCWSAFVVGSFLASVKRSSATFAMASLTLTIFSYGAYALGFFPACDPFLLRASIVGAAGFAIGLLVAQFWATSSDTDGTTSDVKQEADPSKAFARPRSEIAKKAPSSTNFSRRYVAADRVGASVKPSTFSAGGPELESLAGETLRKLGLAAPVFNTYVANFKSFVAQRILAKLEKELRKDQDVIKSMITIQPFDCRDYIAQRIKDLASSGTLAGHYASQGANWNDREWTPDFPSDNQIVLHILDVWLSSFMSQGRIKRVGQPFSENFLCVKKDPQIETDEEIKLWYDNDRYRKFVVHTRWKGECERFCEMQGRDSMYAALTIFFWLVKKKRNFLLDGADLRESPICMDRVFERSPFS